VTDFLKDFPVLIFTDLPINLFTHIFNQKQTLPLGGMKNCKLFYLAFYFPLKLRGIVAERHNHELYKLFKNYYFDFLFNNNNLNEIFNCETFHIKKFGWVLIIEGCLGNFG
jgi:hypothetical protein